MKGVCESVRGVCEIFEGVWEQVFEFFLNLIFTQGFSMFCKNTKNQHRITLLLFTS